MSASCGCQSQLQHAYELACVECGQACCPECAVALESVSYCESCAAALLGAASVRPIEPFDLH
jgi:hypothetical protein